MVPAAPHPLFEWLHVRRLKLKHRDCAFVLYPDSERFRPKALYCPIFLIGDRRLPSVSQRPEYTGGGEGEELI